MIYVKITHSSYQIIFSQQGSSFSVFVSGHTASKQYHCGLSWRHKKWTMPLKPFVFPISRCYKWIIIIHQQHLHSSFASLTSNMLAVTFIVHVIFSHVQILHTFFTTIFILGIFFFAIATFTASTSQLSQPLLQSSNVKNKELFQRNCEHNIYLSNQVPVFSVN